MGVGNTLAGDDGAGMALLAALRRNIGRRRGLAYAQLAGDLYAIWDILPSSRAFLFLDAICGSPAGSILRGRTAPRAFSASFHQSDVSTVMESLAGLYEGRFPAWEIWGITIDPPNTLGEGLSPPVERAVEESARQLIQMLEEGTLTVGGLEMPALAGD